MGRTAKPDMTEGIITTAAYRDVVAALAESEERYRMLVERIRRYAIYMLDSDGIVRTWNRGAEELFGYRREEIVGKSGAMLLTPEDRAAGCFDRELKQALRTGDSTEDRIALHKDGTRLAANDVLTALLNSRGDLIGFGKVTRERPLRTEFERDITAQLSERETELARALALLHVEIEQRRELEAALLTAVDEERQRLGRDLHDDLCQHLGGIALMAESVSSRIASVLPEEGEGVKEISRHLSDAIRVARSVARGLHPITLISQGLPAALSELAERIPIDVEFDWPASKRLDISRAAAVHVYRIAEEAVGNAIRHANATKVSIKLSVPTNNHVTLSISDNGCGFNSNTASKGMGLRNMQYRAHALGGSLNIESELGGGTSVKCIIPLKTSKNIRPRGKNRPTKHKSK